MNKFNNKVTSHRFSTGVVLMESKEQQQDNLVSSQCPPSVLLVSSYCPPSVLLVSSYCSPSFLLVSFQCPPIVLLVSFQCPPIVLLVSSQRHPSVLPVSSQSRVSAVYGAILGFSVVCSLMVKDGKDCLVNTEITSQELSTPEALYS